MAASSRSISYFLYLTTLMIVGILVSGNKITIQDECQGDVKGVLTQCATFIDKAGPVTDPSTSCCDAVKTTDIPCVCSQLPSVIAGVISSVKVTHVAQFCGNPLPPGVQCGS
ncbi:hypothetical protein NE237_021799 [Protea cynaroides]|uniref:Bifunctional inhibitor/plant lipid transfer protein/seed storage helical domain-containing protein n=1 Tax=Protea cynaroides TaxID=273540 RepID=A0A9Q0H9U2_9MAGN|nr:hypothetical protein NE237_021799 [Protea cynaroides]